MSLGIGLGQYAVGKDVEDGLGDLRPRFVHWSHPL